MTERRINTNANGEHQSKLKTIAGLINGLSYREMKELAGLVNEDLFIREGFEDTTADQLIKISTRILSKKDN